MSGDAVRVEPADLLGKAGELGTEPEDSLIPPVPPCGLSFVVNASAIVSMNVATLKSFLASGNAEAVRLSETMGAVALAYSTVDAHAATTIDSLGQIPPAPVMPTPNLSPSKPAVPASAPRSPADADAYVDPKAAAAQIRSGDAAAMRAYAESATAFAATLRAQSQNYSLNGVDWEGTGAEAAGQALRQHQGWLNGLANFYDSVSAQAAQLAEAHDRWAPQHPTVQEIEQAEQEREEARASGDRVRWKVAQDRYHQLFMKSEEVREGYKKDVAGVAAQTPPPPPQGASPVQPISSNGDPRSARQPANQSRDKQRPGGGTPEGTGGQPVMDPAAAMSRGGEPAMAQQASQGGTPSGGSPSGGSPSAGGSPSGGAPAGGSPGGGLPGSGKPRGEPKLPHGASVRPAAHGGGEAGAGGGGGGGGAPATPLQPAVGAETVAPAPTVAASAGPASANAGTAQGAAMGGMGGMAPMAHAAGAGHASEKKRNPQVAQDEDLYTEDRPWTEAVIGNRRRRPESGKESE